MDSLIEALRLLGREQALALQAKAADLDGTAIIDQEVFVPDWKPGNYTIIGAPVRYDGQVYQLLQAHDSTANPDWTPAAYPALWSICHTKDPAKAKPWREPQGTSGIYQLGECYRDAGGVVWRQTYDGDNVYNAEAMPERWQEATIN